MKKYRLYIELELLDGNDDCEWIRKDIENQLVNEEKVILFTCIKEEELNESTN
jgi:hypothetical protein